MSSMGRTLLPLDSINVLVPTVTVREKHSCRPSKRSAVSALQSLSKGRRSLVRLSNSITAGAFISWARSSLSQASLLRGKATGEPGAAVAKALISWHRYDFPEPGW
ncbi:MAG: hypothetical protein ACD_23C01146G0001 [uncultured bacterium]|nr:MAG: hypothetical protein ACD_23C01146G0001 [uncultured bacterium]